MNKFSYNQLQLARIKSVAIGLLIVFQFLFVIATLGGVRLNIFLIPVSIMLPSITMIVAYNIPFRQVLEWGGNNTFTTYRELGKLTWNVKHFTNRGNVVIDQDETRYYRIGIEHAGGKLILEKYPTLDKAKERMAALNELMLPTT